MADDVDQLARARREARTDDVDPDVFVLFERVGCAQKEHRAEQIPLHLEPGVRACVEYIADRGVDARHDHRSQNRPTHGATDFFVDQINRSTE